MILRAHMDEAPKQLAIAPQERWFYHLHETWCSGSEPSLLNKHLQIICVHLLSQSCVYAVPFIRLLLTFYDFWMHIGSWVYTSDKVSAINEYYTAAYACSWLCTGVLSFSIPSPYLPETPFPGRCPSQFASTLSKHFTGESMDLHFAIALHHKPTNTIHTHDPALDYTLGHDRLKLGRMLTTKISFSHKQIRQTSSHTWVTRLTVE